MTDKIALKPYLEKVEAFAGVMSKDELVDLLLAMAEKTPTERRRGFLEELEALRNLPDHEQEPESLDDDLKELDELADDIRNRVELIENGEYHELDDWDDDDGYYNRYDYHGDPDFISEEQLDELRGHILRAGNFFLDGELVLARQLYERILVLINEFSGTCYGLEAEKDKGALVEYCRCVYETTDSAKRVESFYEVMKVGVYHDTISSIDNLISPSLTDVVDSRMEPMPDFDRFKNQWRSRLETSSSARAKILLLELLDMEGKTREVDAWLAKHGAKYPAAWIFHMKRASNGDNWREVATRGQSAFSAVKDDSLRKQAAKMILKSGERTGDLDVSFLGLRELVKLEKSLVHIRHLWRLTSEKELIERELAIFDDILADGKAFSRTRAAIMLARGELTQARENVKNAKVLGWSSYGESPLPTVLGGVMVAMTASVPKIPENIKKFMEFGLEDSSAGYWSENLESLRQGGEDKQRDQKQFFQYLCAKLREIKFTAKEKRELLNWTKNVTAARIDAIVSGKHRKSYWKAAQVAVAWIEMALALGEKKEALAFHDAIRNGEYCRHSAFKRELDAVCDALPLRKTNR